MGVVTLVCGLACLLLCGYGAAGASAASSGRVRIGSAPVLPAGTQPLAAVAASRRMRITVALRPRRPGALWRYAAEVSDPRSPRFGAYLRPAGFTRRFGPTAAQVRAVIASLRAHGLTPGAVTSNRLAIPVVASAAAVERAFSLVLAAVRLPDGRRAIVNTSAPAVDRGVAGAVEAVIGLDGLEQPRPVALDRPLGSRASSLMRPHVVTGGPQPCPAARSAAPGQSAYTSDQIAAAYGFSGLYGRGDAGQGVTIAVYELEPNAPSDIAAYQSCYGTHASVSYVPVDGGAGSGAGSGEAALDIEQLVGLAPRARILVYQGPNSNADSPGSGPYDTDNAIVSQDRAAVVSTSWGECEPLEGAHDAGAENVLFQEAAVQGQTLLAAAGDSGAQDCDNPAPSLPDTRLAVDDPGSQPFVTDVGGTSLSAIGPRPQESTWNNGGGLGGLIGIQPGASGGGVSSLWRMPAYQRVSPAGLHVIQAYSSGSPCHAGAGHCREVPDVAADADPNTGYLIYYNGSGSELGEPNGWQGTGGTSGAAPVWAALIAMADASRDCGGARLGFVNPVLYRLAGSDQGAYFNDVTAGNNDYTGTSGNRYPAGPGYDMATGLGSPNGAALATGLCRRGLRLLAPRPQRTVVHHRVRLRLSVSDAPNAGLKLSARGLPPGLHLSGRRIVGRPRRRGVYHVRLGASDRGGAVRAVRFTWKIVRARS
jgi:subtilase family serine protease